MPLKLSFTLLKITPLRNIDKPKKIIDDFWKAILPIVILNMLSPEGDGLKLFFSSTQTYQVAVAIFPSREAHHRQPRQRQLQSNTQHFYFIHITVRVEPYCRHFICQRPSAISTTATPTHRDAIFCVSPTPQNLVWALSSARRVVIDEAGRCAENAAERSGDGDLCASRAIKWKFHCSVAGENNDNGTGTE